jgi:hypothetical protein
MGVRQSEEARGRDETGSRIEAVQRQALVLLEQVRGARELGRRAPPPRPCPAQARAVDVRAAPKQRRRRGQPPDDHTATEGACAPRHKTVRSMCKREEVMAIVAGLEEGGGGRTK